MDFSQYTLISNTCVGGFLYQKLNREYDNPFMWNIINEEDMLKLVNNFDKIDFNNYKLIMCHSQESKGRLKRAFGHVHRIIYGVQIDNSIDIWYPHIIQDLEHDIPIKIGNDIYCSRPESYIEEKYLNRIKRMTLPPMFIIEAGGCLYTYAPHKQIDLTDFYEKLKLNHKYNKILIVFNKNLDNDTDNSAINKTFFINPNNIAIKKAQIILDRYR